MCVWFCFLIASRSCIRMYSSPRSGSWWQSWPCSSAFSISWMVYYLIEFCACPLLTGCKYPHIPETPLAAAVLNFPTTYWASSLIHLEGLSTEGHTLISPWNSTTQRWLTPAAESAVPEQSPRARLPSLVQTSPDLWIDPPNPDRTAGSWCFLVLINYTLPSYILYSTVFLFYFVVEMNVLVCYSAVSPI